MIHLYNWLRRYAQTERNTHTHHVKCKWKADTPNLHTEADLFLLLKIKKKKVRCAYHSCNLITIVITRRIAIGKRTLNCRIWAYDKTSVARNELIRMICATLWISCAEIHCQKANHPSSKQAKSTFMIAKRNDHVDEVMCSPIGMAKGLKATILIQRMSTRVRIASKQIVLIGHYLKIALERNWWMRAFLPKQIAGSRIGCRPCRLAWSRLIVSCTATDRRHWSVGVVSDVNNSEDGESRRDMKHDVRWAKYQNHFRANAPSGLPDWNWFPTDREKAKMITCAQENPKTI